MRTLQRLISLSLLTLTVPASAHGIHGHIHVTGWSIENQPAGDLRAFFMEPEVMNAALFGAAFTDSGYWPLSGEMGPIARAYSEHTHWEPFIADVVTWIRANDPPPWSSLESRKRAAFFMGIAAHGMQDELFDSLFLHHVELHDQGTQDDVDPGTDGFLVLDDHLRFYPERYVPMGTLLTLFEGLDVEVTEGVIDAAVTKMMELYVNDGFGIEVAAAIGEASLETIPWTYDHYMDPAIPGSLRSEIRPTMGYLQAIWARMHGTFDPNTVVVATFPASPRRLLGIESASPNSWVTFVYGAGVTRDEAAYLWEDADETPLPFARHGTRWSAAWTRLHTLRPTEDLAEGLWMNATLSAGTVLIDGRATTTDQTLTFQTACDAPEDPRCEALEDLHDPVITGWVEVSAPVEDEEVSEPAPDAPPTRSPDEGCQGSSPGHLPWLSLCALATVIVHRRTPAPT